jgi:hypothetical protein
MRIFGPKGNPAAAHVFAVIDVPPHQTGVCLEVCAVSWVSGRKVAFAANDVQFLRTPRSD